MVLQSDAPGKLSDKDAAVASEHTPDIKGPLPGPKAQAVFDRDCAVISPSYTRSYPRMPTARTACREWTAPALSLHGGIAVLATATLTPKLCGRAGAAAGTSIWRSRLLPA